MQHQSRQRQYDENVHQDVEPTRRQDIDRAEEAPIGDAETLQFVEQRLQRESIQALPGDGSPSRAMSSRSNRIVEGTA